MKCFLIALLVLLPLCPRASAWSAPGHMIITALAYDLLMPAEREKLDSILREHVRSDAWQ